jgi:ribose transport system substrate-binding protein
VRLWFLPILILLAQGGCGNREAEDDSSGGSDPVTGYRKPAMGMTFMNLSNPFFTSIRDVTGKLADRDGVRLIINGAEMDASRQIDLIQNYVQQKVSCILLNPVDSDAASAGVKAANQAGIPVITFDVSTTGGEVACFVESNNLLAGQLCADYLGQRLQGRGRILVLDHPSVTSVQQRVAGFEEILRKKYPGIAIVTKQEGGAALEPARRAMESLLTGYPDIQAVFAINDPTALGAAQALQSAGRKDIFIVSIDGAPEAIDALRSEGPLACTVAQFPQEIGRMAFEMAQKILNGESTPRHIRVPVMPVTRENLDQYGGWSGPAPGTIQIPWKTDLVSEPLASDQ